MSNLDPLDLVERDRVAGAVVELGRTRAFVRGHRLGVFQRPAAFKISGDPGRAEHVAAESLREASVRPYPRPVQQDVGLAQMEPRAQHERAPGLPGEQPGGYKMSPPQEREVPRARGRVIERSWDERAVPKERHSFRRMESGTLAAANYGKTH
jgi:hypothetical protein